jgi:hypothetical protein
MSISIFFFWTVSRGLFFHDSHSPSGKKKQEFSQSGEHQYEKVVKTKASPEKKSFEEEENEHILLMISEPAVP